jgi:hypothetical protein
MRKVFPSGLVAATDRFANMDRHKRFVVECGKVAIDYPPGSRI